MSKCLYCYNEITNETGEYHSKCSKKFFGIYPAPELPYSLSEISGLAKQNILSQITIPGVQKKISLGLSKRVGLIPGKLTIFGILGNYILKPPTPDYDSLPENESLTMQLAKLFKIDTVPNSLIRLKSGELAYITKRIDRINKTKMPMEDMAQLTERLTEEKYFGSLEQIGKTILKYSSNAGYDLIKFYEINLFSFITGNADMHLKNFSIIYENAMYKLSPAYDLISTRLVIPEKLDSEEFALTMNGKKSRFNYQDFIDFSEYLKIPQKSTQNILNQLTKKLPEIQNLVMKSFLKEDSKQIYLDIIKSRAERLKLYPI